MVSNVSCVSFLHTRFLFSSNSGNVFLSEAKKHLKTLLMSHPCLKHSICTPLLPMKGGQALFCGCQGLLWSGGSFPRALGTSSSRVLAGSCSFLPSCFYAHCFFAWMAHHTSCLSCLLSSQGSVPALAPLSSFVGNNVLTLFCVTATVCM